MFSPDEIVTLDMDNPTASNTFIVDRVEEDGMVLLRHPLSEGILKRVSPSLLNIVAPVIKDSAERCLDFCKHHIISLGHDEKSELNSLSIYFVYYRKFTPRMKKNLSDICGKVAAVKLNNRLEDAMRYIQDNEALLDEFNMIWYQNFQDVFKGTKKVVSKKQSDSLFNMAGFLMAELNPQTVYQR